MRRNGAAKHANVQLTLEDLSRPSLLRQVSLAHDLSCLISCCRSSMVFLAVFSSRLSAPVPLWEAAPATVVWPRRAQTTRAKAVARRIIVAINSPKELSCDFDHNTKIISTARRCGSTIQASLGVCSSLRMISIQVSVCCSPPCVYTTTVCDRDCPVHSASHFSAEPASSTATATTCHRASLSRRTSNAVSR